MLNTPQPTGNQTLVKPQTITLEGKLKILADAAKYDASCASSGAQRRDSTTGSGMGSAGGTGICHAYTPDGRCISLLKILLTNYCVYDCHYCINRKSSNVTRARFRVDEVIRLTLSFYQRNCIEGLFLSSGIIRSPDYTMEQIVHIAKQLRETHDFRGYIHLKTIPDATPELLALAGRYADRLSINVELPSAASLQTLAPEKNATNIDKAMARIRVRIDESKETTQSGLSAPKFASAGQSTQMIVGADKSTDSQILHRSNQLYSAHKLRRVYYSAFSPIPDASMHLPLVEPPLVREHRLYQSDWLMRFYGFSATELSNGLNKGMLDLELDPKSAWALANRQFFPVNVNADCRERLLRVPGFGTITVKRILQARAHRKIRLSDLHAMNHSVKKSLPFVEAADWHPGPSIDSLSLRETLTAGVKNTVPGQMRLFA